MLVAAVLAVAVVLSTTRRVQSGSNAAGWSPWQAYGYPPPAYPPPGLRAAGLPAAPAACGCAGRLVAAERRTGRLVTRPTLYGGGRRA